MEEPTFFSQLSGCRVDREAGIIYGVRVITRGPATGHNLTIDETTVAQTVSLAARMPNGIKTRLEHKSPVTAINGQLLNVKEVGGDAFADWHLDPEHPAYRQVMNLAERQPHNIGFSLSFHGDHIVSGKTRLARVSKINSADLVGSPAANPSLFEALVDNPKQGMTPEQITELMASQKSLTETCLEMSKRLNKVETFFEAIQKELAEEKKGGNDDELSEIHAAVTELATKYDALTEAFKSKGQKAAPAAGTGEVNLQAKSPEETQLQAKLEKAKTELEAAKGLRKYQLAGKFKTEFGANWKTQLTELEARQ